MIIFLRHGQAENNTKRILAGRTEGVPLTKTGIEQAEKIGKYLKPLDISAIYSSPIERADHTAKIVAESKSIDYKLDERLIELDMGEFTRMPYDEIFAKHGNVFLKFYEGNPIISENGVETFASVQKRVFHMVDFVVNNHKNENVVLVTHMDPIKAMIGNVLSLKPEILFELIIANASLNIFKNHDQKFYVTGINVMPSARFHETF